MRTFHYLPCTTQQIHPPLLALQGKKTLEKMDEMSGFFWSGILLKRLKLFFDISFRSFFDSYHEN